MTELGLIPSDWEVKEIGEVFNFFRTASFSREMLSIGQEFLYVHYGDIHTRFNHFLNIKNSDLPSINSKLAKNFTLIQNGDLIMADASEDYSGIGKSVEVEGITNQKVISGLHTMLMRANPDFLSNGFKAYLHSNILVKKQYDAKATGLKVYGVSKSNLKEIKIPLPPLPEQTAIATALKDTDNLINSLEKLIAKKKLIKQGAMQELLKPKEGWVKKKLGEVINLQVGFPFASNYFNQDSIGIRLIKNRDLKNDGQVYWFNSNYPSNYLVKNGDLLVGMDGDFILCKWDKGIGLLNQRVGRINRTGTINLDFLQYYLGKYLFEIQNKTSATTVKHLSHNEIENLELLIPNETDQYIIATCLATIDDELKTLELKLSKLQTIKQGMMQQLLTGKIRLL